MEPVKKRHKVRNFFKKITGKDKKDLDDLSSEDSEGDEDQQLEEMKSLGYKGKAHSQMD